MTISSQNRQAGPYLGNDVATAFTFAFKVFAASDLQVVRTDAAGIESTLTLTTDYTAALNSNQDSNPGGTVTLVAGALSSNTKLTITSSITPLQATDLTNQGGFYPKVITNALDKLTILIQQIFNSVGRQIVVPISDGNVNVSLPSAVNRALKYLGFDASGNVVVLDGAGTATDSQQVNFLQAGAGAKSRTSQSKHRDVVCVFDFMTAAQVADVQAGTALVDVTAAMNQAAASALSLKRGLLAPSGLYKMTAPWVIPPEVHVIGESLGMENAYDPGATWLYGTVIFKAHTGNAITKTGAYAYYAGAPIENITISSHRTLYPGGNGIVLDKVSNCHLIRCTAFGIGGDCFVMGVSAGDVTGHNYVFNCYSNNPTGVHYRVRQKWGRFHYPVTDGGTHGMYLESAPETHVDGFHFEGFQTAAIRITNGSTSSRFVGKGFIGNTASALNGVVVDSFSGNNSMVFENIKFNGSNVTSSVGLSLGANAIDTRVQGCEFNAWPTAIDNNASYGYSQTWVLDCSFYANGVCIRSNGNNTQYRGNSFDSTTGGYDINHVSGSAGLWTGNVFSKGINPAATGVQGNFSGVCVKNNAGYVSRNSGTTGAIAAYTTWAHGLAGVPAADIVLTTNSSGITSVPQIATRDGTNLALYWTGTVNAQWNWQARLPCDF